MKRISASLLAVLAVICILMLGLASPAAAAVTPDTITKTIDPGDDMTVDKEVTTTAIPSKPDIYFLSDTTGSMGGAIAAVKANANAIMTSVLSSAPDARFGVGNYKDFPSDEYCYQHQQNITSDTSAVSSAIGVWSADGGGDTPEGQLYALTQIASEGVGWRADSTRIVVWMGDTPGHDPVPPAATGLAGNITEGTATAALEAAGIRVIAVSVSTYGLNEDPTAYGGDYSTAYGITEDGSAGQATRIAAATGGISLAALSSSDVVAAIMEGLTTLNITVSAVVGPCDPDLDVEVSPASRTVVSGETATFTETITVSSSATPGATLDCTVTFQDEHEVVLGVETITITVGGEGEVTPPEVVTLPATFCTATLNGELISKGTAESVDVSFIWGTASGSLTKETPAVTMTGPGKFSYTLDGLTPGKTYYYEAKAVGDGKSYGEEISFKVPCIPTRPAAPRLLCPANKAVTKDHTPYLDWTTVTASSKVHYQVQVSKSSSFSSTVVNKTWVKTSSCTTKWLSHGKYYWRVRAIDASGNKSNWSTVRTFRVA